MPHHKLDLIRKACESMKDSLESCAICPRRCRANRSSGRRGYCRAPLEPVVYSAISHHGEEPPISGTEGSGTIFFSHCGMKCVYCQNYYFSQLDQGRRLTSDELAGLMRDLEKKGCHNINLVSPTHFLPQILKALEIAVAGGLSIPIVYNTGGYELPETIQLLSGIVDIYLADMRYSDNAMARKYSDCADYVEYNRSSIVEMHNQAGVLECDKDGIGIRGLIIRLLVLPHGISGVSASLRFIQKTLSSSVYLSIMSQYYPTYKAYDYSDLSNGVSHEEYKNIVDEAKKLGLNNGWIQEPPDRPDTRYLGTNLKSG